MPHAGKSHYTIGTLAATAGVNIETIRYYQRRGLLAEPERESTRIRRYGDAEVARIRFIKAAQRLGFSLDDVAGLLRMDDGAHCDEVREVAEQQLQIVRAKLGDLRRVEAALAGLVGECQTTGGTLRCPLIAALERR